jgi:hypothetical protein
VNQYAARKPAAVIELLSFLLAPPTLLAYWLDRLVGRRGDTLDNVLLARRPAS